MRAALTWLIDTDDGRRVLLIAYSVAAFISVTTYVVVRSPWYALSIAAPLTFAAYAAGRDPALEAALAYTPGSSLAERLVAAAKAGGTGQMMATLAAYDAEGIGRYADNETALAEAGQRLGWAKLDDAATALLEEGARRYPDSSSLTAVLAFVSDWGGRPDAARKWARRTLAIDPNNRTVRPLAERPRRPAG